MTIGVEPGDCLKVIPRLVAEGIVCDAVVTDPPYHLTSVARGQTPGSVAAAKDVFARVKAGGFMGQSWDGGDIAFRAETWAVVATILRPGAFLVAFGGTRTYHRLACAIEDGGFVIQDCLMWLFATGFPKRRDMLKPAYEPIVLAYKPGGGRTMQVDECRIAAAGETFGDPAAYAARSRQKEDGWRRPHHGGETDQSRAALAIAKAETLGRWPANVCHDGSDEVVACFPQSAGQLAFVGEKHGDRKTVNCYGDYGPRPDTPPRGDSGSAARFFFSSKAGAEDRYGSRHPTIKPVELMKWLVALVTPPGGLVLDPFAGSGTTGIAALATGRPAILVEREASYVADIRERLAFYEGGGMHSTAAKARHSNPRGGLPLFGDAP